MTFERLPRWFLLVATLVALFPVTALLNGLLLFFVPGTVAYILSIETYRDQSALEVVRSLGVPLSYFLAVYSVAELWMFSIRTAREEVTWIGYRFAASLASAILASAGALASVGEVGFVVFCLPGWVLFFILVYFNRKFGYFEFRWQRRAKR
jgi:hypothetical protein